MTTSTSMGSRVVPGRSETMTLRAPTRRFKSVDLPTFGRPMMATRRSRSPSTDSSGSGRTETRTSRRSPTPRPWYALTGRGSPSPSFQKRSSSHSDCGLSSLLAATTTGISADRRIEITPASSSVILVVASTTRTTASAPDTAASACSFMDSLIPPPGLISQPPVSTRMNSRPIQSASNSRRSLVTPESSSTTAALFPSIRFTRVDLPTFGRPTTATTGTGLMRDSFSSIRGRVSGLRC